MKIRKCDWQGPEMLPHLNTSWTTSTFKESSWLKKRTAMQIEGQIGSALKGSNVCSAVHTWSLSFAAAAAAAFLPSDRCPAVTPAAAAAVALPPPVPLGEKTQRFGELVQKRRRHTFEQCRQHWDGSTLCTQRHSRGLIDTFKRQQQAQVQLCKQLNPSLGQNLSCLEYILKVVLRIIYDKARKHPDFLLWKEIIEMLTFLKFHSVNFWLGEMFSTQLHTQYKRVGF